TPAAFGRKIRLAHGHWLLVNTTRAVTQIAADCGFADGAHFCRWFKTVYGETPTQFRDRRRDIWTDSTATTHEGDVLMTPTVEASLRND
ncbi:MAG: helix-turn-helix transcriptional regulator, partial [Rhodospirillaceae bacterium]|nr:helix-turn-helix transcriptional regulator [Rhodospirillaceae bacterium]